NAVRVPDAASGLALLKAGRVQALRLSRPTVRWMAARDEAVESVEVFEAGGEEASGRVAFAFRREDGALREEWDRGLGEFMRGAEYGEIAARFGFDPLVAGEGAP
ncbi:MAG: transporter substrate-binding domain-containing protein, partial [Burkholderiales bacterium]|nr:transporter substrate-binding domain-containing protein [Opitutaceae bacterium]